MKVKIYDREFYCDEYRVLTLEELLDKPIPYDRKDSLKEFFDVATMLTPDHVDGDNIYFYFLKKDTGFSVIVFFEHFEDTMVDDLDEIKVMLKFLGDVFFASPRDMIIWLMDGGREKMIVEIIPYTEREEVVWLLESVFESVSWNVLDAEYSKKEESSSK